MLINVNESTGEVTKVGCEKQPAVLEVCDRLKDELGDWLSYGEMKSQDGRYELISKQEFQHAMVALNDLFEAINKKADDTEKLEFAKLITTCVGK